MLWKVQQRLTFLNQLIKQKATGSPPELAKKLGITERAWYKLRDELVNDLGLPIEYCHHSKSYVYTEEGSFEIGFRKLTPQKSAGLNGGRCFWPHGQSFREVLLQSALIAGLVVQSYQA